MIEALRPHTLLLARVLNQEIADDLRDFGAVGLQREVAGVEEANLCQRVDHLVLARPIGPCAVNEYESRISL